jgi:uncharacterized membrane protein
MTILARTLLAISLLALPSLVLSSALVAALCVPALAGGNNQGGNVRGAPGPIAGAGLPVLAVGYGVYWLIRRRRQRAMTDPSRNREGGH